MHDQPFVGGRPRRSDLPREVFFIVPVRYGKELLLRLPWVPCREHVPEPLGTCHNTVGAPYDKAFQAPRDELDKSSRSRLGRVFVPWVTEIVNPPNTRATGAGQCHDMRGGRR